MRRLSSLSGLFLVVAAACAAVGAPGQSAAQGAGGGAPAPAVGPAATAGGAVRSGPAQKSGPGFSGTIAGRLNLIAPAETATAPTPFGGPPTPPAPLFAPERIETLNPTALNQLKLPDLAPKQLAPKPAAPKPAPPAAAVPPLAAPPPGDAAAPPPEIVASPIKQPLSLSASFGENGAKVAGGVKWRLFTDQSDKDGEHMLVAESTDAAPRFELDPGPYIVHAVYGLVSTAKFVNVKAGAQNAETIVIAAGGVRFSAFAGSELAPADAVSIKLTRDVDGVMRVAADNVRPGVLMRLPAGRYHVSSTFGDANASVEADMTIAAGKFVEAQLHHRAAKITLKLLQQPGGPELRDTSWTVMTPGGDVIRDSIGALDGVVLAEGDYLAIARRDGQLYQQSFAVKAGVNEDVQVLAE